jgi:hypothetical protein
MTISNRLTKKAFNSIDIDSNYFAWSNPMFQKPIIYKGGNISFMTKLNVVYRYATYLVARRI